MSLEKNGSSHILKLPKFNDKKMTVNLIL